MTPQDFQSMFAAFDALKQERDGLQTQLNEVVERLTPLVEGKQEVQPGRSLISVVIAYVKRLEAENIKLKADAASINGVAIDAMGKHERLGLS
jgi:hypothetical protein